jgi:hypothetical protein
MSSLQAFYAGAFTASGSDSVVTIPAFTSLFSNAYAPTASQDFSLVNNGTAPIATALSAGIYLFSFSVNINSIQGGETTFDLLSFRIMNGSGDSFTEIQSDVPLLLENRQYTFTGICSVPAGNYFFNLEAFPTGSFTAKYTADLSESFLSKLN